MWLKCCNMFLIGWKKLLKKNKLLFTRIFSVDNNCVLQIFVLMTVLKDEGPFHPVHLKFATCIKSCIEKMMEIVLKILFVISRIE